MAGGLRFLFTAVLILSLGYKVEGWWGNWWNREWSESKPTNCPSEDEETHVCSSITSANGTCITIRYCTEDDGEEDEYREGMEEEYDSSDHQFDSSDGDHHGGHHGHRSRRWCVSIRNCIVYKCCRYCCEGYTKDMYGRCVNETTAIDCQNGGSPYQDYAISTGYYADFNYQWKCSCPRNFTGTHCEKPICHCDNGGVCQVGWNGQPYCQCREGYTGHNCSQRVCSLWCENGGSCVVDGDRQMCICPENYVGETCEDRHVNDRLCPNPASLWRGYDCRDECSYNYDCDGNQVCCKEGCSMMCRHPKDATCEFENRMYPLGANITSAYDPCRNCSCHYSGDMVCTQVTCASDCTDVEQPVNNQKCCPTCAGRPPVFDHCPTRPVNVTADYRSHMADLTRLAKHLVARDYHGRTLTVTISPSYLTHCICLDSWRDLQTVVATATDMYGSTAECRFEAYVQDLEPPRFLTCPGDIFVFEEEVVTWKEPETKDNVGIYKKTCNNKKKGSTFPVGVHNISYTVMDFEFNIAICDFRINVTKKGTDFNDMPEGLRQRAKDKGVPVAVIVTPVVGLLVVIIAVLLMYFLCHRRRLAHPRRQPRTTSPPRYDNNIYTVCGPVGSVKYPKNALPINPPAYSPDLKEGEYAYIEPPSYKEVDDKMKESYDNPGYSITMDNKEEEEK